jgi:ATP-dependent DNA helicase RecQ
LHSKNNERSEKDLAANYLFLLPSLITRLERLLVHFLLRQGLIHRPKLSIGVIERDLECAEISLASFFERLSRLSKLYGIEYKTPNIQLYVQRNPAYRHGNIDQLKIPAKVCNSFAGLSLDLVLDVGIKCNSLTKSALGGAEHAGSIRQAFSHNMPVRFSYRAQVQPIQSSQETEEILNSFVRDFFRKYALRSGQGPILKNILSQKSTIGLLPTSAGKSLCYQLAALLTPGSTIVVDPIVALMKDQTQSLVEQYGIDRVLAWHAGARFHDENVAALLCENIIVFLSPERLLRPQFRAAMRAINAADIYINYAVIDEAHCVSMWGHDFRPSYLTLERNFREYCTFQGRPPVLVALTGTASQLVLIDLKRELNIQDVEAIIRPDTFDALAKVKLPITC